MRTIVRHRLPSRRDNLIDDLIRHQVRRLPSAVERIPEVIDYYFRATRCQQQRVGSTDPSPCACHQRHLPIPAQLI